MQQITWALFVWGFFSCLKKIICDQYVSKFITNNIQSLEEWLNFHLVTSAQYLQSFDGVILASS